MAFPGLEFSGVSFFDELEQLSVLDPLVLRRAIVSDVRFIDDPFGMVWGIKERPEIAVSDWKAVLPDSRGVFIDQIILRQETLPIHFHKVPPY